MKSRCMSMMRSAVADQSSATGSGSAVTVLINGPFEFAMVRAAPNESSRDNQSKARAIVYNAVWSLAETKSNVFSIH
jgi:hypothetical protein